VLVLHRWRPFSSSGDTRPSAEPGVFAALRSSDNDDGGDGMMKAHGALMALMDMLRGSAGSPRLRAR
jgi:hypothetical protein